jgi:hypothetical protein
MYTIKGQTMSGRKKPVDTELLIDLISSGMNRKDTALALGISPPTLDSRIAELQKEESALLAYDKVHHLDLINVRQRLTSGVTDEKIAEAPLSSIAQAYGIFTKAHQLTTGRPTELVGLMGYLMRLEKEDRGELEPLDCEEAVMESDVPVEEVLPTKIVDWNK